MTHIEKIQIEEKLKRKNLEIKELEGQLRKQYDEIQELIKKLGKRHANTVYLNLRLRIDFRGRFQCGLRT